MPYQGNTGKGSKKKSKKKGGVSGFVSNFVDDVQDAATGLIPGLVDIGSMVVHDAGKVVGLADGEYQLDDFGSAIKSAYSDPDTFWGEAGRGLAALVRGDLDAYLRHARRQGKAFYDAPLGPVLDVASIFTGGAGVAAKGAALTSKAGVTGARAARFAGLDPKTMQARTVTVGVPGGKTFERKLASNPVIRARQQAFERLSSAVPEATPLLGQAKRAGRNVARLERTMDARERAKFINPVNRAIAGLKRDEKRAVHVLAGGHNIDDLIRFTQARVDAVRGEIARKKAGPRRGPEVEVDPTLKGLPDGRRDVVVRDAENPLQIGRGGDGNEVALSTSTDLILRPKMEVEPRNSLVLRDDGRPRRAGTDEELAYEESELNALLDADRRDNLKTNNRNLSKLEKRLAEYVNLKRSGVLDAPSERLARAVQAVRDLSAETTRRMTDQKMQTGAGEASRAMLEAELLRVAGIVDAPYAGAIRSHVQMRPDKVDVGQNRSLKFSKPGVLAQSRHNSGYAFWNALDEIDPGMYVHAARQIMDYQNRTRRFAGMLESAVWVSKRDAALMERDGWRVFDLKGKDRKEIDTVYATLVDAEQVFGDLPGYDEMVRAIEGSLMRPDGSEGLVPVVPKAYYSELVSEFNQANAFIRKWLDNPTRVWRALTLNLRPAWIVNNYVGQMMLLAVSYGVSGLKEYVTQFSLTARARRKRLEAEGKDPEAHLMDELAPELSDFGWAHQADLDVRDLRGNKVTRGLRRMSDFMGNLNQRLTDDHVRRAAFMAEMRPRVKAYQKANPDASFEDAARTLWQDERFADEVTQRVLGNLIDFSDLSHVERQVIKRAIPFWSWIKGISKRTGRMVGDEPWKVAAGNQVSQWGLAQNEAEYGDLPPFMRGLIGLRGDDVLVTPGLNPFATPADVTAMGLGAFLPGGWQGSHSPLSTINPVLRVPVEAAANIDMFSGQPITPRGEESSFAGRFRTQAAGSFAQMRLLDSYRQQRAFEAGEMDYDPIYQPSLRNAVMSYLGVPIRTMNRDVVAERAAEA